MKFRPVRIDENPMMKMPIAAVMTLDCDDIVLNGV